MQKILASSTKLLKGDSQWQCAAKFGVNYHLGEIHAKTLPFHVFVLRDIK